MLASLMKAVRPVAEYFDLYRDEKKFEADSRARKPDSTWFGSEYIQHYDSPGRAASKKETGEYKGRSTTKDQAYVGRKGSGKLSNQLNKLVLKKPLHKTTLAQWFALFAGILIQPYFQQYQTSRHWEFDGFSGWIFFSLIVSFLIFPAVYRHSFDTRKPVLVQLAPIFASGLGWQSIMATALKAAGKT